MLWNRLYPLTQSSPWRVTVGLEIHAQLKSRGKLFSRAPNRFGARANQALDAFDIALPGSQPVLNKHAIYLAVRAALALKCTVNPASTFDRKHYFYPDQPAGYQITQNYNALAHNGLLSLYERDGIEADVDVGISQLQIEQDTARTTYLGDPPESLVDLNRSGAPLIEIVTTPSLESAKAAGAALRKIQAILRATGASDANMEAGGMRCDVNVSVTTEHDKHLGPSRRVEIKNLASGRIVSDAVEAEFARQVSVLEANGPLGKETRGYDVEKKQTFLIRSKESTTDYRYMPDPDLSPVRITQDFLQRCLEDLPELPDAKLDRLLAPPYELALKDAKVIAQDDKMYQYYQEVLHLVGLTPEGPRIVSNWIVHELAGRIKTLEESGRKPGEVTAVQLGTLIKLIRSDKINRSAAKIVLQAILDGDARSSDEIATAMDLLATKDSQELESALREVMNENKDATAKLVAGDTKIQKWFVGQVMRSTKGYVVQLISMLTLDVQRLHTFKV